MASYHIQINVGAKGKAVEHARYIGRVGAYSVERGYGEIEASGVGNMPEWAREDMHAFWRASDEYERANGNTYREYELALPRELSREQRVALVERFASQELGTARPYQWAIHNETASDGLEQPHVHLMFSDRQQDGIERGPEQFFKRYNAKHPEKGGAKKATYGANKQEAALVYEGIRERWATIQNQALEMVGSLARVDHRSLAAQGIVDREPELHRGPAVSGIEARGEDSYVGQRQREQRHARTVARAMVVAEVKLVTREELALERVAVRERRELARELAGSARQEVLPLLEADRREQLGRAQAAAERRIERRQSLSIGRQLKERLLTQARALRERLGVQLTRVKEWVRERFAEPRKPPRPQRAREMLGQGLEPTASDLGALEGRLPMQLAARPPTPGRSDPGQQQPRPEVKSPDAGPQQSLGQRTRSLGEAPEMLAKPVQAPAAKVPRSAVEQERERLATLSAGELWKLYYARNPSIDRLVERDAGVVGAQQAVDGHRDTAAAALERANRAALESERWREAHGMQARLHDLGLKPVAYLAERAAVQEEANQVHAAALEAVTTAMERYSLVRNEARQRITQEIAPAKAHAAELKQLAHEAGEREALVREFERLADYRERRTPGYEDHSPDWQATPATLRQMIDVYNHAPPEVKQEFRQQLSTRPERAQVLEKHLKQRRELGLDGPEQEHTL